MDAFRGASAIRAIVAAAALWIPTAGSGAAPDTPRTPKTPAAERPNVLFCFADDWGRYASAYAKLEARPGPNSVVKTPHIDRVAAEGVLFRNAFVNSPSCTPCRSALLSGRYFFRCGRAAILSGAQWDGSVPAFPPMLHDNGYHIGETWKVWSPGTPNDAPFGAGKFAYEKAGGAFNNFSENAVKMVKEGTPFAAANEKLLDDVRGNFTAFLAARPAEKPFFYWFGPTNVHRTWVKGSGKTLWGIEPDDLQGKMPVNLPDVPEVREDFADYLGEAQAFDAAVGVLLKQLEAAGELERTVVVVSGDHGAPGFPGGKCNLYDFGTNVGLMVRMPGTKPGRVVDDFVNLMDLAPTFLELGGVAPPADLDGRSIVPLLKSDKEGRIDPARGWVVTGRERHVDIAREGNLPYPQRALRTQDFLYIRNFRPDRYPLGDPLGLEGDAEPDPAKLATNTMLTYPDMDAGPTKAWLVAQRFHPMWKRHYEYAFGKRPAEELYDLRKDPEQWTNVAGSPGYAAARKELAEQLMKTLTDAGDPRVTGDGETFEKPPFTDPGPPRRKPGAGGPDGRNRPAGPQNRNPAPR